MSDLLVKDEFMQRGAGVISLTLSSRVGTALLLAAVVLCIHSEALVADDAQPHSAKMAHGASIDVSPDANWPSIRGPRWDGTSAESGIVNAWPTEGPPVLWTRELGQGYSSFVAWDNRIATQYQSLQGQYVICLDAKTGQTVWQYRYDWPYDPAGVYPGPRATPTWWNHAIYFASPAGLVGCLDARNGKLKWSVQLAETFHGEVTGFGYSCSPTVVDGLVLLPVGISGASMVALDALTGRVRWKSGSEPASYAPAYPISLNGRPLVLGYLENALVCHDRYSGELLWSHKLSDGYDEHSSWPLYQEPYLWISSPFRAGCEVLELSSKSEMPVQSRGKFRSMSNDIFSSVLIDGAVYGFDVRDAQAKTHRSTRGTFRCIDFATGEELWAVGNDRPLRSTQPGVPHSMVSSEDRFIGHATVIAADGKLILFNDLGELILATATAERFEELGRTSVLSGEICWTQPALCRGRLFVRNQSRAACVYLRDPESLPLKAREHALTTADIPQQAYFDWASIVLGVEPEYAFDLPSAEWLKLWFQVCLVGLMGGCLVVPLVLSVVPGVRGWEWQTRWLLYWASVFVAGAVGTTLLSPQMNEFVFTWPVSVFAAYQPFIDRISLSRKSLTRLDRIRSGLACAVFVAACLAYFLACRRLSLVFEWVFLVGFVAAAPVSLAGRFLFQHRRWTVVWRLLSTILAFAAFYWSSVAFLYLRVR